MERRTYHFSGHVQGVGFRYTTHNIAQRHNVYGYVRNLPDGRVELVMEGDEREMEDVVQDLRHRMSNYVANVETQATPATGEFERFRIKHC
jgi:acylphosphatase